MSYQQYAKEIKAVLGYRTAWPLNKQVRLGDIGIFDGDVFQQQDNLENWKIPFAVRKSEEAESFDCASVGAVSVNGTLTTAQPTLPVSGQVELGFSRPNAAFLRLRNQVICEIEDKNAVGAQLMALGEGFNPEFAVVVEVMMAERAALLVAGEAGASAMLSLEVPATGQAGASAQGNQAFSINTVAKGQLTPLFRTQRVVRRFFGGKSFKAASGSSAAIDNFVWVEAGP